MLARPPPVPQQSQRPHKPEERHYKRLSLQESDGLSPEEGDKSEDHPPSQPRLPHNRIRNNSNNNVDRAFAMDSIPPPAPTRTALSCAANYCEDVGLEEQEPQPSPATPALSRHSVSPSSSSASSTRKSEAAPGIRNGGESHDKTKESIDFADLQLAQVSEEALALEVAKRLQGYVSLKDKLLSLEAAMAAVLLLLLPLQSKLSDDCASRWWKRTGDWKRSWKRKQRSALGFEKSSKTLT